MIGDAIGVVSIRPGGVVAHDEGEATVERLDTSPRLGIPAGFKDGAVGLDKVEHERHVLNSLGRAHGGGQVKPRLGAKPAEGTLRLSAISTLVG